MKQIQKKVNAGSENSAGESKALRDLSRAGLKVPDISKVGKDASEVLSKPVRRVIKRVMENSGCGCDGDYKLYYNDGTWEWE